MHLSSSSLTSPCTSQLSNTEKTRSQQFSEQRRQTGDQFFIATKLKSTQRCSLSARPTKALQEFLLYILTSSHLCQEQNSCLKRWSINRSIWKESSSLTAFKNSLITQMIGGQIIPQSGTSTKRDLSRSLRKPMIERSLSLSQSAL